MHAHTHACAHKQTNTHAQANTRARARMHAHAHTYTRAHKQIHMHKYTCTSKHTHTRACMHTRTQANEQIHMHNTHTHTSHNILHPTYRSRPQRKTKQKNWPHNPIPALELSSLTRFPPPSCSSQRTGGVTPSSLGVKSSNISTAGWLRCLNVKVQINPVSDTVVQTSGL